MYQKERAREVTSGRFVRILLLEKHCTLQILGAHKDVPEMYRVQRKSFLQFAIRAS